MGIPLSRDLLQKTAVEDWNKEREEMRAVVNRGICQGDEGHIAEKGTSDIFLPNHAFEQRGWVVSGERNANATKKNDPPSSAQSESERERQLRIFVKPEKTPGLARGIHKPESGRSPGSVLYREKGGAHKAGTV